MTTDSTTTLARASGTVPALVGDFRLRDLPYSKTDSVADLDAPRAIKPKPPKPSVTGRACALSKTCDLRKRGKCDDLHCSTAAEYISNASGEGRKPSPERIA